MSFLLALKSLFQSLLSSKDTQNFLLVIPTEMLTLGKSVTVRSIF